MLTRKNIDRVCIIITVIAVLATALFMNARAFGVNADDSVSMGYEDTLFDDSYVHSIDIQIDDWDSFLETATNEEYTAVNVTIDGETIKNVALRAKGNTSLSTVSQLGSERYSLKLEFDRYESSNTYHGLDKLCLNNLIQDYTMMKDYIAYKLMNEFGVASPLVSYVYVTVNGEDWGLFLAVEAVEDSFLERNYGTSYGDLYKPDSMSMGGGRGNGGGFDMREMDFDEMGIPNPFENGDWQPPEDFDPENMDFSQMQPPGSDGNGGFPGGGFPGGGNSDNSQSSSGSDKTASTDSSATSGGSDENSVFPGGGFPGGGFPGGPGGDNSGGPGGGGFGMGSNDAKLQYSDDDVDSYSTIFDNAKTTVTTSDKKRLISALKSLNEGVENGDAEAIADAVDIDAVLRYMVVHNFVVNGDSYTGSMIHNYYLYEENGIMSMIPWDYNLAYGTFQADSADSAVNDPIDNPLSITDGDTDRPMFSWIISCEEYTEMYHEYYEDFLAQFYNSGYLTNLIDTTYEMIHDYVDKDPTKFCETSEFETAVSTIREFVTLRFESISGQLDGTIGSTDAAQEENPDALIDASSITLSAMGSMGGGGGGGPDAGGDHDVGGSPGGGDSAVGDSNVGSNDDSTSIANSDINGSAIGTPPSFGGSESDSSHSGPPSFGDGNMPGDFGGDMAGGFSGTSSAFNTTNLAYLGGCILLLVGGIVFAMLYKRRGRVKLKKSAIFFNVFLAIQ